MTRLHAGPRETSRTRSNMVGLVGLAGAGNFGDDLIFLASLQAVYQARPDAQVRYIAHDCDLDWRVVLEQLPELKRPVGVPNGYEVPLSRGLEKTFSGCEVVFFGGGGLLQDTHHPLRPYHWLRVLPANVPVVAVGLGLGPLRESWVRALRRFRFSACHLRDTESEAFAKSRLGWEASMCSDFVDAKFLDQFLLPGGKRDTLGVALRAWPGLDEAKVVRIIDQAASRAKLTRIEFFVLESKRGQGDDVDLARRIAEKTSTTAEIKVTPYMGDDPIGFVRAMSRCAMALSMKLHSSVVWNNAGVPIIPIIYAPKVASFFNVQWRGLEVLETVTTSKEENTETTRAADVVRDVLTADRPPIVPAEQRIARLARLVFQVLDLSLAIYRRARKGRPSATLPVQAGHR